MHVTLLDLRAQLDGLESEMKQAVNDVIDSTRYIGGPEVEELERPIARYTGGCGQRSHGWQLSEAKSIELNVSDVPSDPQRTSS